MSIDQDNIVTLIDEEGNEVSFEHIDTIMYQDHEYVLLLPTEPVEGMSEDEEGVVILRIIRGDDEDAYENVEDEALLDTVFEMYLATMEEEEDDEDS
jgi:uncharacterized protein YrzB (UPF0473 family)